MTRRSKGSKKFFNAPKLRHVLEKQNCYEGERLAWLLKLIKREVETVRQSDATLPEKFWLKQQFSIGVNDVTRVLERMAPSAEMGSHAQRPPENHSDHKISTVQLQAVLLASDCKPRWLTEHLPSLTSSRNVPLIFVKDNKAGSLRLGELVKLKTAIAIGIKILKLNAWRSTDMLCQLSSCNNNGILQA
ncbi:uncharacterized protein LOC131156201 isoform X2 [Malania oleifera]|uniref:uncharacterized protein LOC131156201 isoform X2 n=1 Tax=Malania oleifera TaxID=397392 RepID=UPI0025AE5A0D|nr:uncharacterized protein LOC131156201 isoform X2 [Malania oleifera]